MGEGEESEGPRSEVNYYVAGEPISNTDPVCFSEGDEINTGRVERYKAKNYSFLSDAFENAFENNGGDENMLNVYEIIFVDVESKTVYKREWSVAKDKDEALLKVDNPSTEKGRDLKMIVNQEGSVERE